tara:strand:+ start:1652 stop:4504 length:2853 start_codon:yes stop_codon:yes gene_type:complete
MSYKQISDIERLYSSVHDPIDEEFNDIMTTVVYGLVNEGYSENAIVSFLETAQDEDIVNKYLSVDMISEELEYFDAMESGLLTEDYFEEKFGIRTLIKTIKKGKGLKNLKLKNLRPREIVRNVKKTVNPKGFKQRQKFEKELLQVNPKATTKQLDKYSTARFKGKNVEVATRFANQSKGLLGKIKDKVSGLLPWAIVGGATAPFIKNSADKGEKDILDRSNQKDKDTDGKKDQPGSGRETITNPEYGKDNKATDHKGRDFDDPEAHSSVRGGPEITIGGNNKEQDKKQDKKEIKPEVKDYLGKDKGLLGKEDWLKKSANSPAAKAFGDSDEANEKRWQQQLKHRQWQKDNNRGAFKVKKEKAKVYTNKVDAFLNNKKVGDKKGTGNHKITQWQDLESYEPTGEVLSNEHFVYTESLVEGNIEYSISYFSDGIDIQEKFGTRLIKNQIRKGLNVLKKSGMADDLGPSATMSGLSQKMGSPSDAIKGFVDGASDAANFIKRVVKGKKNKFKNPVSKPKLTHNTPSTERIPSGGPLAVRNPSPVQKVKDAANAMKPGIDAVVKTAKQTFKKGVKGVKYVAPRAAAVAGGAQVGLEVNKRLNKESANEGILRRAMELQELSFAPDATPEERSKAIQGLKDRSTAGPKTGGKSPAKPDIKTGPRKPKTGKGGPTTPARPPEAKDAEPTTPARPPKTTAKSKDSRAAEAKKPTQAEEYVDAFDLVLEHLVETQQVDSMEEALYVMMEMDQDAIYGIVQERSVLPGKVPLQVPLKKVVKKALDNVRSISHGGARKPSTGKYTVKGNRKVKATQGAKQEGTFNTRQKDKLKAQQAAKPEAKAQADAAAKVDAPRSGVDVRKGKAATKDADARNMKGPKYENYDSGLETAYQSIYEKAFIKNVLKGGAKKVISKAKVGKKMPAHVKDSIKRQYKAGTPGAQPYTIEDKKNVIDWYKKNK